jgi:gamma-glutamyltranspeptidase/glutathione hydrolase
MFRRLRLARSAPGCRAVVMVFALAASGCAPRTPHVPPVAAAVSPFAPDAPDAEYQGVAAGQHGAVSSTEANASDIGIDVLRRGGNAVDAAVAVAFALGVTHPSAGNIGGGGFLIVRTPDGRSNAFDYREVAPSRASERMFLDAEGKPTEDSRIGPRAAGIPGVVRGLEMAHRRFGRLPWKDLVTPAVRLARDGWPLDTQHAADLASVGGRMQAFADALPAEQRALRAAMAGTLAIVRKPDGTAFRRGDTWRQPDLAATLEAIADGGADAFYTGPLARRLADAVTEMGGIWSADDLAAYRPIEREPVRFDYHGHEIVSMPPPSAGGINLRQILAGAEVTTLRRHPWESPERIHLYAEIARRAFADSTALMGDPAFVDVPQRTLFDPEYARRRMAGIDPRRATPSSAIGSGVPRQESPETTHFSVIDRDRMAVASTFTLNGDFGAKVIVPGTGVILNNEMDDFTAKPGSPNMFGLVQSARNAIAPGKRMVSSMTPTIVVRDGQVRAVVGSPGGPTIISTVAQIVLQLVDYDRSLAQAVGAVRVHHQWLPDEIAHEDALPAETAAALRAMGHQLRGRARMGVANCIEVDPETGALVAVADVKRDGGRAAAY